MRSIIVPICVIMLIVSCSTFPNETLGADYYEYKNINYYSSEKDYKDFLGKWPNSKYFDEVSLQYSQFIQRKESSKQLYNEISQNIDFDKIDEYYRKYYDTSLFNHSIYDLIAEYFISGNSYHYIISKSDRIDFSNPHSFIVNDIYIFDSITINQWIGTSFVARVGWWSSELVDYPFDNTIFIMNSVKLNEIKKRNNMVYAKFIGVANFNNALGANVALPVFDIIYFSKSLTYDR